MIVDYIDVHKVRFGVEQICRVLTEHGIMISPSTYYARSAAPSTATELNDAYAAHEVFCLFHDQRALYGVLGAVALPASAGSRRWSGPGCPTDGHLLGCRHCAR